jgi:phosphoserine phosphatase
MNNVVVLIADPARADLHDSIAQAVREALGARAINWLAPGIAAEIEATGDASAARTAIGNAPIDVAIVPTTSRRKKLLVADMESTLIENEFVDDIGARAGLGDRIAAITRRSMAGELDFAGSLRERVAMLKGFKATLLDDVYAGLRLTSGAKTLIATMRAHGAATVIVTGGFRVLAERVRATLGADAAEANHLIIDNGVFAGMVSEPIVDRPGKRAAMQRHAAVRGLSSADILAVGDGANDIEMVQAAGLGVAFRAKQALADVARVTIRHGDLTALLYLQGYRASEFAA